MYVHPSPQEAIYQLRSELASNGYTITTGSWQGMENPPEFIEILHADVVMRMPEQRDTASIVCGANQPWADKHFDERVGGEPLNPPPSHVEWLKGTSDYLSDGEVFSHSYPERMWPKGLLTGVRFNIGDLNDAVKLLKREPDTRQCYIPIWFPEDLSAAVEGERVPCTFGWHFMLRNNKLHCFYPMRSCDAVRHYHNDIYFAIRLTQWLIQQAEMKGVVPGLLHFSATSFHCFSNDRYALEKLLK